MTTRLETKSCSIIILHKIRNSIQGPICDNTVLSQRHGHIAVWCKKGYNICRINLHTYGAKGEDITQKLMIDNITLYKYQLHTSVFILNLVKSMLIRYAWGH